VKALAAVVLLLATSGIAVALARGSGDRFPPAAAEPVSVRRPPRVDSRLPAWLASGAKLNVDGWAGPGERVRLLVDGRRVASAVSGRRGRFALRVALGARGVHRLAVAGRGGRTALGRLAVRPLVLAAVGDVTPGETVSDRITASAAEDPWTSVGPVLRRADIAVANLEGVVSSGGTPVPGKEYHLRGGPVLLARAAREAGIDVLTVANNHSLDYGPAGFLDTLAAARRAGIATIGGGPDLAAARRPVIVDAGGLRVALLGYSDVRPLGFTAGTDVPGTAPADPAVIAEDVARARRRADAVVVFFHWGIELQTQPDARQRDLAQSALAAGADVVLGSHPHVLQPVERSGRHVVAWSLGNFVFPANSPGTTRSGILLVSLGAHGVDAARLLPATIHGFRPVLDAPG
jgi:poly-gamma-glutamate synthesis protein (capsule biosynthesis protein)